MKYHEMAFSVFPLQSKAGVTPDALLKAEVRVDRVKVLEVVGRMPASDNHS